MLKQGPTLIFLAVFPISINQYENTCTGKSPFICPLTNSNYLFSEMCKYIFQVFEPQAKYELKKKYLVIYSMMETYFKYRYVLCFVMQVFYFTCVIADKHSEVA